MTGVAVKPQNAEYFIGMITDRPEVALALMRIIDDLKAEVKRLKKKLKEK